MLLEEKLFDRKQDKASKDALFLIHLIFQSNLSLKISHQKLKNVTRGGGSEKCQKVSRIIWMAPYQQNKKLVKRSKAHANLSFLLSSQLDTYFRTNLWTNFNGCESAFNVPDWINFFVTVFVCFRHLETL
jgi:hypothetical protein